MTFGIRVTLDDGTIRMRSASDDDSQPQAFSTAADAEAMCRKLAAIYSVPHPDGRGDGKPFCAFEVIPL